MKKSVLKINADPNQLRKHVEKLSKDFAPRHWAFEGNLNKTAAYIIGQWLSSGGRVSQDSFAVNGLNYKNVFAEFGPEQGPLIIVGAHYDVADKFPGADDNASGVAGLIELGRMLGKSQPQSRVMLAAYPLEEPPYFDTEYMGSYRHVRNLIDDKEHVRLMICLEMIGFYSALENSQRYPSPVLKLLYPSTGNFIAVVQNLKLKSTASEIRDAIKIVSDLPAYSLNVPAYAAGIDLSDHRNFWSANIDAVMITDTAMFRNKAYHSEFDTAERLDYTKMAKVIDGVYYYL